MDIKIRKLSAIEEIKLVEDLQLEIWGYGPREVIPSNELLNIIHSGGILLGAFYKKKMIGFCFGFTGIENQSKIYHCSRMVGVIDQFKGKGIGYLLKMKQRNEIKKLGINEMRWTFDPLQIRNAYFNISKLQTYAFKYCANLYGLSNSIFNKNIETDRFWVKWDLTKKMYRSKKFTSGKSKEVNSINKVVIKYGVLNCLDVTPEFDTKQMLFQIPSNFQEYKSKNQSWAKDWRAACRLVFIPAFKVGYKVTDMYKINDDHYYLLEK